MTCCSNEICLLQLLSRELLEFRVLVEFQLVVDFYVVYNVDIRHFMWLFMFGQ